MSSLVSHSQLPERIWLNVYLRTIADNLKKVQSKVSPCGVVSIVKANAYGLGVRKITEGLVKYAGAEMFGVATPIEAIEIADIAKKIILLSSIFEDEIPEMVHRDVIIPVSSLEDAEKISNIAQKQNKNAKINIKIDTGMGRLGIMASNALPVIESISKLPNLEFEGIFSHFPNSMEKGREMTLRQIDLLKSLINNCGDKGIGFNYRHIANSDAIANYKECAQTPFNLVRTGINLHGSFNVEGKSKLNVVPAIELKTRIIAIRDMPAGHGVGYGSSYVLKKNEKIATLPIGYADGLPFVLSNKGRVLIRGKSYPIVGRLSMDYTTVSLGDDNAQVGDEVVLFGKSGNCELPIEEWAKLKGSHAYEVLTLLGKRIERKYIE